MTHRRPLSSADRDTMILRATSAGQCWFVVLAGLALLALACFIYLA